MPPTSADTATAPRIRQYEQVQRRAVLNPSVNFTRKRTVPQWHAASISPVSFACIVKLPSSAGDSFVTHLTFKDWARGFEQRHSSPRAGAAKNEHRHGGGLFD